MSTDEGVDSLERVLLALRSLQGPGDTEMQHKLADAIVCDFLRALGYVEIAEAYDLIDKWYS